MMEPKLILKYTIFVSFLYLISNTYSATSQDTEVLNSQQLQNEQKLIYQKILEKKKKGESLSYEDFKHHHKGCPESSICSKQMGNKHQKFKKFISRMARKTNRKKVINELNKYLQKNGLPIKLLAKKDVFKEFEPIMWNSACPNHNPTKKKNITIYQTLVYANRTGQDKLKVKVGNKTKKLKIGPEAMMDKAYLLDNDQQYILPHKLRPLYMKDNEMIVLKNFEDFYFGLSISPDGKWKVVDHLPAIKSFYQNRQEVKCPKDYAITENYFKGRFCQKVYDLNTKKYKVVSLPWSCI